MVVADEAMSLLTVCENGYGKRTPFGPGESENGEPQNGMPTDENGAAHADAAADDGEPADEPDSESEEAAGYTGGMRYRRQRRGGKGLRDIRTSARNGKVVDIVAVSDDDEVLMVTAGGKIQRVRASDIRVIGRNTQGVRIIRLDEGDTLVSMARIPGEIIDESAPPPVAPPVPGEVEEPSADEE
jgi:DNA gyrase subunit A